MIPIHEKLGRICGFTARKLAATPEWGEKKAPKYMNSPETPIFQKSQILFNLHQANKAIKDQKDFILVEGQLDAIRCFIEGFQTVIAPQGTAFTESQADLLKKSNPRSVICLLDGDEAGRKAGLKYVPIFIGIGLNARFATIPMGSDPDQILLNEGKRRLNEILDGSISMIEYVIKNLQLGEDINSPNISKSICDFIFTSLNKVDSLVIKEGYLKELATLLGVSNQAVKQDFLKFEKQKLPKYRLQNPNPSNKELKDNSPVRLTNVEDDLLFILLHDDRIAGPLAYLIEPSWLNLQTTAGNILAKIFAEINADGPMDFRRMEDFLENDQERKVFHHCLYKDHGDEEKDAFLQLANECLSVLFLRSSKEREEKIRAHLRFAEENAILMELRNELKEIRKLRSSPPTLSLSSPPN